jgi:hypothetical protein
MGAERDDDLHPEGEQAEAFSLLASALPERTPSVAQRDKLLAALHGPERFAPFVDELVQSFGVSHDALRDALARIPDSSAWRPGFWPDSELLQTPELARASTLIARLAPGSVIAQHQHPFRELTYVLDGDLTEDGKHRVGPGELLDAQPGTQHAIAVTGASPCLVVFAIRKT